MSDISIVTAFWDIGRGDWTPDKGLPHYLQRSTQTYLERFGYLAQLDTDMTIFTSRELAPMVADYRRDKENKTKIIVCDPRDSFPHMRNSIVNVQQNPEFIRKVDPTQAKNPEYWNPDYVLVTDLKAFFTNFAVENGFTQNDMVAWIDFGYCRSMANIPNSKKWDYDFDPTKIHLFSYKDHNDEKTIEQIVLSNDVYILGAKVVAHKSLWKKMSDYMTESFDILQKWNLVDDDQGLWLLSYKLHKQDFELHTIPDHQHGHDPFVLFNQFNNTL